MLLMDQEMTVQRLISDPLASYKALLRKASHVVIKKHDSEFKGKEKYMKNFRIRLKEVKCFKR